MTSNAVSNKVRAAYGIGDYAICLYWSGVGLYLLYFYTDVVGITPLLAGWIYALGIAWDAITDPFMGYLAERTRSKMGSYRPYIFYGAIPLALSFVLLFWVPPFEGLLLFVFLNAMPVAVTSTLYLFYVDHVLGLEAVGGVLLILFFLSAAFSAPLWTRWAEQYGALQVLRISMLVSVLSFFGAYNLNTGEVIAFSIICFATGLSLGADMTILPAIFAKRLAKTKHDPNTGFGIWNFSNKLALALTAGILLPLMEFAGFETQDMRSSLSREILTISYAIVPCGLKIFALIWLQNLIGRDENL